jgi:hypothetical protein
VLASPTIQRVKLRGIGVVAALVLATSGCGLLEYPDPQVVEMVAGGGAQDSGVAVDAAVRGRLIDMVMGSDGVLHILTEQNLRLTVWTVAAGQLTRTIAKNIEPDYISQAVAGPDNSVCVALWNGGGGVWQIKADGTAVLKTAKAIPVHGVAFRQAAAGAAGQMYIAEHHDKPVVHQIVRNATGNNAVVGRDLATVPEPQWRTSGTRSGFTDGTPGTQVTVEGGLDLPLAVAPDGSVYAATTRRSVIAVRPDAGTEHVIGAGGEDSSDYPEVPFEVRGQAADADVDIVGRTGPVTDRDGNLYLVSDSHEWGYLSGAFDWTGDVSEQQQDLLIESRSERKTDTEVMRISPDGSLATVAGHADAVAVDDKWIYLARAFRDIDEKGSDDRVIVVRTAKS